MPLDGNPNKTMGLIAHPNDVVDFCASKDGRYLFTCGGEDLSVKMWAVDVNPIEAAISMGGQNEDDIAPFIKLIEGGKEGQNYQDMKDFFYYSQIISKKENTTKTRKLTDSVPLDQLPNLMRAMGYYPTEQEVQNMKNEVKYSKYSTIGDRNNKGDDKGDQNQEKESNQLFADTVDMETFIRLFVNHRPVYGIGKNNIEDAFRALHDQSGNEFQLQRGK